MSDTSITVKKPYQFGIGNKANPNGRPKGSLNESTYIKKALKRIAKNEGKKDEIDIVVSYVQKALKGNTPILLDYMNRTFGVPKPIDQQQVMQPIIIIPSSLSDKYIESTTIDNDNNSMPIDTP